MLPLTRRLRSAAVVSVLGAAAAQAHLELYTPYAIYSQYDPQTEEANKNYSMTNPLDQNGDDFPAKNYGTSAIVSAITPVATLVAGEDYTWDLKGTATHNGGSCQVGISYDYMETMAVMASWIGGCPLDTPYTFTVPDIPGCTSCLFWWAWWNETGNREMYQNAAVVAVTGTADSYVGPGMFRSNTYGAGICETPEGTDVVFPNPGDQVFYGGDYSSDDPPTAATLTCDWDNDATVTVTSDSGSADASASSTDDATATATATATSAATPASDSSAGTTAAKMAGTSAATAATSAASGATQESFDTGEEDTSASVTSTKTTAAAASPSSASTSASSSSSSSSSSTFSSTDILYFLVGAVVLLIIGGAFLAFAHHSSSATQQYAGVSRRKARRRGEEEDPGSTSDSDSSSEGEKR